MALAVHNRTSLATSAPSGTRYGVNVPLLGSTLASRRSVGSDDLLLTKRPPTALHAYSHPASNRRSRKSTSKSTDDSKQHMTLTPYPPRNKREVAEGVWTYILLGGLLYTGMLFVLPEFSMAIPMIMKAIWG